MLIAIDGTAASGKGTLARLLSLRLDLVHIDSGKIYRLVGLRAAGKGLSEQDGEQLASIALAIHFDELEEPELSGRLAGNMASKYAKNPTLRNAVKVILRHYATKHRNVVIDGRDIGTEVFPLADVKIFVNADPKVRAERRVRELAASGVTASSNEILAEIIERDEHDRTRTAAPLKAAADAVLLDTTNLDVEEAVAAASAIIERRTNKDGPIDRDTRERAGFP